ncbi:uncharacterized protein BYT42DRAFT_488273 [Radiomyces spectabilis]|uniref:uncharacterized protein n=1 Tax=Radiomyces spectabilis TaxID=64574 RepID=UPI002220FBC7|nr:uncharacterized protein BYT42DRAFT_488273 [Radiomyces spectabilis]KAI8394239.1 hypothetical protein BYT42DRAFT_488273 [Radiomyces spectabilis]
MGAIKSNKKIEKAQDPAGVTKSLKIFSPNALKKLHSDFEILRHTALKCPKCLDLGHINKNGHTKTEPPMPIFLCRCGYRFGHIDMRFLIDQHNGRAASVSALLPKDSKMTEAEQASVPPSAPSETPIFQPLSALRFEHHEALPEFMTTIMAELNQMRTRMDQYDALIAENQRLKKSLAAAEAKIAQLEAQTSFPALSGAMASKYAHDTIPPPTPAAPATDDTWAKRAQHAKKPKVSPRRMTTLARAFAPTSETHGFQYVYIPSKFRMKTKALRQTLRTLGFDNSRILDIHYPDRQVVALLIHNDYHDTLLASFARHNITPIKDFNPHDQSRLRDPKFNTLSLEDRQREADQIHRQRLERALKFIREPVKFAVARSFHSQKWIDDDMLRSFLQSRTQTESNAATSTIPFRTTDDDDDKMILSGNNSTSTSQHEKSDQ